MIGWKEVNMTTVFTHWFYYVKMCMWSKFMVWGNTILRNDKQTILKSIECTAQLIWYATFINSEYSHVISIGNVKVYVSTGWKLYHSFYI